MSEAKEWTEQEFFELLIANSYNQDGKTMVSMETLKQFVFDPRFPHKITAEMNKALEIGDNYFALQDLLISLRINKAE